MSIRDKIYQYFDRKSSLRVLLVFKAGLFSLQEEIESVDEPWREGYLYHVFEGDWFTTKYRLANDWAQKKVVLLFPDTQEPTTQDACAHFPLMSVMEANMVFHDEDAVAFMQQRGMPEQFRGFFDKHITELQRNAFDKVFAPHYSSQSFSLDVGYRGLLSVYLSGEKMMEWYQIIVRIVALCAGTDSKAASFWKRVAGAPDVKDALDRKLVGLVGFSYDVNSGEKMRSVVEAIKYNAITQNLAPDNADPYKRLKIQNSLQLQAINTLLSTIAENPKLNALWQPAFKKLGADIREETLINVYGIDAQYVYLPEAMARLIVERLIADSLCSSPTYALERLLAIERHLADSSPVKAVLSYAKIVAGYYEKANAIDSIKLNTPELYIRQYLSTFYLLDQSYRHAVMAYVALKTDEKTDLLESSKKQLDVHYAALANEINLEWVRCIKEKGAGFETVTTIERQADLFKNYLRQKANKVVVIVSDALRYEMGEELVAMLGEKKYVVAALSPILAMLPTETKYTKTALLPHKTLTFKDNEMEVDGKVLVSTEQRTGQLQNYVPGGLCLDYDELMGMTRQDRCEVFKRPLVYVFHNTIDKNCHGSSAPGCASAFESALDELAKLVAFLHDSANVTEVYVTSDHGFLYNDTPFEDKDKWSVKEENMEKKSRYYLTCSSAAAPTGITKFPLQSVSAMQGNCYVCVPTGTNRLAVNGGDYEFAHGGASLQEVIVPLIHSKCKRSNVKQKVSVVLFEKTLTMTSSRLKAHLVQGEAVSMDRLKLTVECAIYVNDRPVSRIQTITLDSTDEELGASRIYAIDLTVTADTTSKIMQLKVFEVKDKRGADRLNPLIQQNIINNTLIEQDDF